MLPNLFRGRMLRCKYPKNGKSNILKWYRGTIQKVGSSKNGIYVTIQQNDGQYRTLLLDKMIEAISSAVY
jgi:hypothetical protein